MSVPQQILLGRCSPRTRGRGRGRPDEIRSDLASGTVLALSRSTIVALSCERMVARVPYLVFGRKRTQT